ncbi:hypothetical protein [Saccharothrix sp.]|uniref:hypothetical protein n=1 Tax=Saccharothrix sp. TaxID=1873460 RepID=UPI002810DEED|nr:hypothetical protein [Saccharothrix sp.]
MSTSETAPDTGRMVGDTPEGHDLRTDACEQCGAEPTLPCSADCLTAFPNHALLRRVGPEDWAVADCPSCQGVGIADSEPCACLLDRADALALLGDDLHERAREAQEEANRLAATTAYCDTAILLDAMETHDYRPVLVTDNHGLPGSLEISTEHGPVRLRTRRTEPGWLSARRPDGTIYAVRSGFDGLHGAVDLLERTLPELACSGTALVHVVAIAERNPLPGMAYRLDLFEPTPADEPCPHCRDEGYEFAASEGCPGPKGHMWRAAKVWQRSPGTRRPNGDILVWGAFPYPADEPDAYTALDHAVRATIDAVRAGYLKVS